MRSEMTVRTDALRVTPPSFLVTVLIRTMTGFAYVIWAAAASRSSGDRADRSEVDLASPTPPCPFFTDTARRSWTGPSSPSSSRFSLSRLARMRSYLPTRTDDDRYKLVVASLLLARSMLVVALLGTIFNDLRIEVLCGEVGVIGVGGEVVRRGI